MRIAVMHIPSETAVEVYADTDYDRCKCCGDIVPADAEYCDDCQAHDDDPLGGDSLDD